MANPLDKVKSFFGWGAEGSNRSPFFGMGENGHMFELGHGLDDGFQRNLTLDPYGVRHVPAAYAGVMANAKGVSQCTAQHVILEPNGKRTVATTSAVALVLRRPNDYETWNQFILNMVADMQFDGESFAVIRRDPQGVISSMHRMAKGTCSPYVTEDGTLFYSVGSNVMLLDTVEMMVPAREVLHMRSHTPRHPLMGESPLRAAALALGINVTLSGSQAAFFNRMSRPSGIISTDQALTRKQILELREAWADQSQTLNQGGVPILGGGMKFTSMGINSQDAQLIEAQRLSIEDIARVIGVPLPIIGDLTNSTLSNVSELVSLWLSVGKRRGIA